ncbi:MAG: type I-C CRISPR-associated protein Cas5c [Candidatus Auribacterota bacterium]
MPDKHVVRVKVTGDFACFTRPELKVERMSYPCMTPSAARGVLDSILWKPEFKWFIRRILVLNPIKFFSIKRNEIDKIIPSRGLSPIIIEDNRAQRNSLILRDVAYVIEASVHLDKPSQTNPPIKYIEMFNRRVNKGQCWRRPYLGCREFYADFIPASDSDTPINEDIPVGGMLLDIFYDANGNPEPMFFNAAIRKGILSCENEYERMMSSSHISERLDDITLTRLYSLIKQEELL